MSLIEDPAGAGVANVTDAETPVFTSKNALVVAVSNFEGTAPGTPQAVRLSDGTTYYKATTPSDTQPVSATSLPLPTGASTSAAQTDGTQKSIVRGGAKGGTTASDVTSTSEGTDHQALDVQLYHSSTAINPTQIRALTSSDTVTSVQGTAAAASGAWTVKITDGTTIAGVDASNHQYVSGKSAVGASPASNPVSVSGIDGGGLKRSFLTDTSGNAQVNNAQWIGSTAPTVGQKTMTNSLPVTVASDQSSLSTKDVRASTASVTSVAAAASDTLLLSSNSNRLGATVYNDSTALLYLKFGSGSSSTSHTVQLVKNAYYEVPFNYTGALYGTWSSATGSARVTEVTA